MSDGTIVRTEERVTFRYERRVAHPVDTVWHAITDPTEIGRWMGTSPELELRPGGHYISHHGDQRVVDRILRLEPPHLFEHTFFEYVNPGAVVTWQLDPVEAGTLLTLTHVMTMADVRAAMSTVAAGDDPITILSRNAAGWHHLLDLVAASLDGDTVAISPDDRRALQRRYATLITP